MHGDLGEAALEQLSLLAQEVFLPLLCNPHNQAGWPEMVTREVMDNMYKFSASACITVGLTKGQTLLPVPPVGKKPSRSNKTSYDTDRSTGDSVRPSGIGALQGAAGGGHRFGHLAAAAHASHLMSSHTSHASMPATPGGLQSLVGTPAVAQHDLEMIHVVESSVVLWTRQIKNVLRTEPDQALKEGTNPGPLTEVEFWKQKATSLNAIQEQLASLGIHRATELLKHTSSTFYPAFEKLRQEVDAASKEANSNVQFLTPLQKCAARARGCRGCTHACCAALRRAARAC